jgi:HEAT repeat protein
MNHLRPFAAAALAALILLAAPSFGADDLYRQGQKALDEARYVDAVALFERLAAQGGSDADAALYWQAYALAKAGRRAPAREVLDRLTSKYPKSQWVDDARALLVEIDRDHTRPAVAGSEGPEDLEDLEDQVDTDLDEDEEMKLYALNSLMNTDSARAVAILEKFLAKKHSRRLDEQAIFVLSQSDAPGALQLIAKIARGELRPELRMKAIETLGLAGDPESLKLLGSVYQSGDPVVRAAVLQAYFLAGETEPVLAAARGEGDAQLRRKAIEVLGLMGEGAALAELYRREGEPDVRAKVIEAFGLAGDAKMLGEIARADADPELRAKAIQAIGVFGGDEAPGLLSAIYRGTTDVRTKERVIDSFITCDCAKALIEIARTETNRELRRKALQVLSVMGADEASDFLLEILDED